MPDGCRVWRVIVVAGLVLAAGVTTAEARTLFVANNGTDSSSCGAAKNPCRSLSQAIANASARDTISVGPGRYGDLNLNGVFGEAGEEAAPSGCNCMILVDKRLTITSRDGAFTTVLDATVLDATVLDASGRNLSVVRVAATGVVFGSPKHGFMFTGGGLIPECFQDETNYDTLATWPDHGESTKHWW